MPLPSSTGRGAAWQRANYYVHSHSTSWGRYLWEQLVLALFGWVPSIVGLGLRGVAYRTIMHCHGWVGIESGVRLAQPGHVTLRHGAFIDHGVYLHACPQGIDIGENSIIMHHSVLHVYNFRLLPHAFIRIGRDSLIGEMNVIRGQGGVSIGDRVYTSPLVQLLAVNHVFTDPSRPFIEQGITAKGIVVEDDVWIGAGAVLTDGVRVGRGAVVGAGAVVTHDVPPHTVAVGVPARVIRELRADEARPARDAREVYL